MKTTAEKIAVMQAYLDGKKVLVGGYDFSGEPAWDLAGMDYDIAPVTKPSINWDHVAPEYKWLAVDGDKEAFLYSSQPEQSLEWWNGDGCEGCAELFASYIPGTCDWRDSLVQRPE